MKIIRIILIILAITWMAVIFAFSNQPADESTNTSSRTTRLIVKIIYGKNVENIEEKVEKINPIIRKLAHYTIYLIRRNNININTTHIPNRHKNKNTNKSSYTEASMQSQTKYISTL